MEASTIALIIIFIMLIFYVTEVMPIAVTSVSACIALAVFGVLPITRAFAGFGNDIIYLIVGMIIVGNALVETGVAHAIGKKIIYVVGTNERIFMLALVPITITISMFLSNTASVSIMIPIAASAIAAFGGKLTKKNTFMMLGILSVTGGSLTIIGSTPQLIAQGFLIDGGHETIGFFELSRLGLPIIILLVIYYQTIGYILQKKFFKFDEVLDNKKDIDKIQEQAPKSKAKMAIVLTILVLCVIGFLFEIWSPGIVAMVGAILCIATGCISQKNAFLKMDWTTIAVMWVLHLVYHMVCKKVELAY